MKNQFHPKYQQKYFWDFGPVYYIKVSTKQSLSSCKQNRDFPFCVNLEVVNFQGRNPRNIFVGILDETEFS